MLPSIDTPYFIIISRKNQALLSFLKLNVVVDGKAIYPLLSNAPVIIPVYADHPKLVITDGFHFTRPIELTYTEPSYYNFNVECAIGDLQLLGGAFVMIFFYLMGFLTGWMALKVISFFPIIFFLFYYYVNRKEFIQVTSVKS